MVLSCREVWREISNYIENDLDLELRAHIEEHLAQCRHCTALLDSTRNLIVLIADERTFHLPAGFSARLRARLEQEMAGGGG
jgi:predicted anti-sigma-YlaC factor YlaD